MKRLLLAILALCLLAPNGVPYKPKPIKYYNIYTTIGKPIVVKQLEYTPNMGALIIRRGKYQIHYIPFPMIKRIEAVE